WLRGDEHAAVVDREVTREVRDRERELAEQWESRALLVVHHRDKVLERVRHRLGGLPAVLGVAPWMVIRRMHRRGRTSGRVDVVLVDRARHEIDSRVAEAERLRDLA